MTFQLVRLIALPALLFTFSTLGCVAQGASAYDKVVFLDLARAYGVSRQPVQQALLLLRDRGLVREAPGRGPNCVTAGRGLRGKPL